MAVLGVQPEARSGNRHAPRGTAALVGPTAHPVRASLEQPPAVGWFSRSEKEGSVLAIGLCKIAAGTVVADGALRRSRRALLTNGCKLRAGGSRPCGEAVHAAPASA